MLSMQLSGKENLLLFCCCRALLELWLTSPLPSLSPWVLSPSWSRHPGATSAFPEMHPLHHISPARQGRKRGSGGSAPLLPAPGVKQTPRPALLHCPPLQTLVLGLNTCNSWSTQSCTAQPENQRSATEQENSREEGQGAAGPMRVVQANGETNDS